MAFSKIALVMFLGLSWNIAIAQINGEEGEPTPEFLDATFTSDDAAQVAAGFSDEIVESPSADPVARMTEAADLVFRGDVLSQSYDYDAVGTPYTHTTFLIREQLKGDHQSNVLTLVQPGGPSQSNGDKVLMVSTTQYFNVGEEELLFISLDLGNQVESLRATILSRFRVYEDKIYNEDGYGVLVTPVQGGTRYKLEQSSERNPNARFKHINIGAHQLSKEFSDGNRGNVDAKGRGSGARQAADKRNTASEGADVDAFSALIGR